MKKIALFILFGTLLNISIAADHPSRKQGIIRLKDNDEGSKITLKIGDKTYDIQMYNLSYHPKTAKERNESTFVNNTSNTISISIRSSKLDQEFIDWIFAVDQQPKDGQIIVYDGDSDKVIKTITFTGATTSSYNEGFNIASFGLNNSRTTTFGLRYKTVSIKL